MFCSSCRSPAGLPPLWQDYTAADYAARPAAISYYRPLIADYPALQALLNTAPLEATSSQGAVLELPLPDGTSQQFEVEESPVMAPGLAARYPEIRTYRVRGLDDPGASGRLDITPNGFHAMLHTAAGTVFLDPDGDSSRYRSYFKQDHDGLAARDADSGFVCQTESLPSTQDMTLSEPPLVQARTGDQLRIYRLALAATGEYTAFHGGSVSNTLAAMVTAINRVNQIMGRDLAVGLVLVANNDQIIYTNAATDPYTNNNGTTMLTENQDTLNTVIGVNNYDIGHVFSTGGGGIASVGSVCVTSKARGVTGLPNPTGDPFYIDYVAHELGHQLGANHSFNATTGSCGGSRFAVQAYEPGSGSTIMSYAGICGTENLQSNTDATFHAGSIEVINTRIAGTGSCFTPSATGNSSPLVSAGASYTIPASTPFTLTGSATDVDGDTLSYQWDQMDRLGTATNSTTFGTDLGDNPLFRSFLPKDVPYRHLPRLGLQLSGSTDKAETLPTSSRTLNFRLTARDGRYGVDEADMQVTVNNASGPFQVTSHNTNGTHAGGSTQNVTWNPANTANPPVNCASVAIDLLTFSNDESSYCISSLADTTANDGSATVSFPVLSTSRGRVRVSCADNIFYDISNTHISVTGGAAAASNCISTDGNNLEHGSVFVDSGGGISVSFSATTQSVTEGDSGSTSVTVTAGLSSQSGQTVTVPFTVSGSASGGGVDHNAVNGSITIPAGNLNGSTSFSVLGDTILEDDETVVFTMGTPTNADIGPTHVHTVTIIDDEAILAGNLQFSSASYSVAEDGGSLLITIIRSGGSAGAVSVDYATADNTATAGNDYTAASGTLSFANGVSSQTFSVSILEDTDFEASETVDLALSTPTGGATLGTTPNAVLTITDNDGIPEVNFSPLSQSLNEGNTGSQLVTFSANLSGTSIQNITLPFTVSGTATAGGNDHDATDNSLIIPAGSLSGDISFNVIGDTRNEPDETVVFTMGTPTNAAAGSTPVHSVNIMDDDALPSVQFSAIGQSTAEGNSINTPIAVMLSLSAVSGQAVEVPFTLGGTATNPADHTATGGTITIPAGSLSVNILFDVVGDTLDEPNETVVFTLGTPTNASLGTNTGHTLTITDDDAAPIVNFSSSAQSVIEGNTGNTAVTVTASLSAISSQTVTVPFTLSGTAANPTDHDAQDGTISIPAGSLSGSTGFNVVGDTLDEASETVIFSMGTPTNASAGVITVHTVTLNDDDATPSLQFSAATYSVSEAGPSTTITVTRGSNLTGTISVSFASSDDSATAGIDYTAVAGTLNFADGASSQSFSVPISDDSTFEGNETLNLTLSSPVGATLGQSTAVLTIIENDPVPPAGSLQFSNTTYSVNESGPSVSISVTRSGGSFGAVTVDYASGNNTASAGSDYTSVSGTLSFGDGVTTSQTFTIPITEDTLFEGNETINLSLGNPTGGASLGSPANSVLTLIENDAAPLVNFSSTSQSIQEGNTGDTMVNVIASLNTTSSLPVTLPFTVNGTASAGVDHAAVEGTITIPAGSLAGTYSFDVLGDTLDEPNETVVFTLGIPTNASIGATTTHTVTITDDDAAPSVNFTASGQSVIEGNSGNTVVIVTASLSAISSQAVTVPFTLSGTAGNPADHSATSGGLSIPAGNLNASINFNVVGDTLDEVNETIVFTLGEPINASLGTTANHTVSITDDDATPSLQFSAATYSVSEALPSAVITVTRSANLTGAVSVGYTSSDGSASAGSDYTLTAGTLNFANGESSQSISVPITDDSTFEGDETLNLTLLSPVGATLGQATSVLTIIENDPVPRAGSLQFSNAIYSVSESGPNFLVSVTRSNGSFGAVTVDYTSSNGSASASADYTAVAGTLSFGDGVTTNQTFTIPITEDTLFEGNETINLSLGNITGEASLGSPATAVLTIIENDAAPVVNFSTASQNVTEGNTGSTTVTVTASLNTTSSLPITVPFTVNGTSTASVDHAAIAGTITIPVGSTSGTFTFNVLGDTLDEPNETVVFSMGIPNNATAGTTTTHTVTITDDDAAPIVNFSSSAQSVIEGNTGNTAVSVTASLSAISSQTVSVPFTLSGTASNPTDHDGQNGTISIPAGSLSGSTVFNVVGDTLDETSETVIFSMGTPTNASAGVITVHTVTLNDDDATPSLQFSAVTYSVSEAGPSTTITVTRGNNLTGTVSVSFASSDDSASAGSDYTAVACTPDFADGVTSQSFNVPISDDSLFEGNETLNLTLSNPVGAVLGQATAVLTIIENDPVPPAGSLQFSNTTYSVNESGPSVLINVTRSGGSSGPVSVDYASSNGTASAGSDYTAVAGTLSFSDGVTTSQTFSIPISEDAIFEANETINLTLSNATGGAILATPSSAEVFITENDLPPVAGNLQFSSRTYSVVENAGSIQISVTRTGGSFGVVNVDYASSDESASAGSDYSAVAGTLTFGNGVTTSQTFTIPISNDLIFEGDETVNLTLSNATGGATLATPSSAILTITEDDHAPPPDSNGDGLSDADASALGLDPNDPDGDTDNDGSTDVFEVGSDINNPLDSDQDGLIDALEPGISASDATIASGVDLESGATASITTTSGETLSEVSSIPVVNEPSGFDFPYGSLSYIATAPTGGSITVQLSFSVDLPADLVIFKIDGGNFIELPSDVWTQVDARNIELTLTDGGAFDQDGVADGKIEDPIALGVSTTPLPSPTPSTDSGGGGGGAFDLYWLLLLGFLGIFSRRLNQLHYAMRF